MLFTPLGRLLHMLRGGAWAPGGLSPSELHYWYDSSDVNSLTLVGSDVSAWSDKSGNGNDVVQGTVSSRPLYIAALGGLPALGFSGDFLIRANMTQGVIPQPITTIIVGRTPPAALGGNTYMISNSGTGGAADRMESYVAATTIAPGMYAPTLASTAMATTGADFTRADACNGVSSSLAYQESGGARVTTVGTSTAERSGISIGTYNSSVPHGFTGHIREIIGLASVDPDTIAQAMDYARAKWGHS